MQRYTIFFITVNAAHVSSLLAIVYVLILPVFDIISHIICHERGKKEVFGNLGIIFAIMHLCMENLPYKAACTI